MNFRTMIKRSSRSAGADVPTFTVNRLITEKAGSETDVSHMIDRTYRYQSMRELRWHLADRFGLEVASVEVRPS
jgi:hypothetical protein